MRIRTFVLAVIAGVLSACASQSRYEADSALILENINIVDIERGSVLPDRSILIVDGKVAEVAKEPGATWPEQAPRPDVSGAYLSPALIDSHVHIYDERDLQMISTFGIQAVRSLDGWAWHLLLRDDEKSAEPFRATLLTSGKQYQLENFDGPEALANDAIAEAEAGFDWIKLYDNIDGETLEALSRAKQSAGLKITGHLPDNMSASKAISSGVFDDIAHVEELLPAMQLEFDDWRLGIQDIAALMRQTDTAISTTVINNKMIGDQAAAFQTNIARDEVRLAPPILQVFWKSEFNPYRGDYSDQTKQALSDNVGELLKLMAALNDAGVEIMAGTDAPNPTTVPGFALHEELVLFSENGFSPTQALRTATTIPAKRLLGEAKTQFMAAGADANFIITYDNPLESIHALQDFSALVRRAEYSTRSAVLKEREGLAAAYAADLKVLKEFSPMSAQGIIDKLNADEPNEISRAGLTSVIWVYMKFGNLPEARRLAALQATLFPEDASAVFVQQYLETLDQ